MQILQFMNEEEEASQAGAIPNSFLKGELEELWLSNGEQHRLERPEEIR